MSNQYIGSRYVPKMCGDWDSTKATTYESLSVVQYSGASYTSKQAVPTGIDITNTTYWVKTADYNAQVATYHADVLSYKGSSDTAIANISNDVSTFKTDTNASISAFQTSVNSANTDFKNTTNTTLTTNQQNNLKMINGLSHEIGNSQCKKGLMAQAEKYLLKAMYELDNSTNMLVVNGIFTSNSPTTQALGVKGLNTANVQNITLHAGLYWNASVKTVGIGFANSVNGTLPTATQTTLVVLDQTQGFYFKDTSLNENIMLIPSQLTEGWYDVSISLINNGTVCKAIISITKGDGVVDPHVYTFDNIPFVNNIVLTTSGSFDMIRNIKYAFLPSTVGNLMTPQFEMTKNFHYPIQLSYKSKQFFAYIPASYKGYLKNKVVVFFHDKDRDGQTMWSTNERIVLKSLLDEGYVVISSNNMSLSDWGNAQSIVDFNDLIDCYKDYLNIQTSYFIYSEGMGFLSALNLINHSPSIRVRAILGLSPAVDLSALYNNGTGSLSTSIASAYGLLSASEFATKTNGYNPMSSDCKNFVSVPMLLYASASDTIINKTNNADAFMIKMNGLNGSVIVVTTTGDHLDLSNYVGDSVVNFFDQY